MAKSRQFTITLSGTIPKGMTLAQVRHAYWNDGFNGDSGRMYNGRSVDVSDYPGRAQTMVVRLGRASLKRG